MGRTKKFIEMGDYGRAIFTGKLALARAQSQVGPEHPDVLESKALLANVYFRNGQYRPAKPLMESVLAARKREVPQRPLAVAAVMVNLGMLANHLNDPFLAENYYREAVVLQEQALGPDHVEVRKSLERLAKVLEDVGRRDLAESCLRRILQSLEHTQPADALEVSEARTALGWNLYRTGQYALAEAYFLDALNGFEARLGPDALRVAQALGSLGVNALGQGRLDQAEIWFTGELKLMEVLLGPEAPGLVDPLKHLAQVLRHAGRRTEAHHLERRAALLRRRGSRPARALTPIQERDEAGALMALEDAKVIDAQAGQRLQSPSQAPEPKP